MKDSGFFLYVLGSIDTLSAIHYKKSNPTRMFFAEERTRIMNVAKIHTATLN